MKQINNYLLEKLKIDKTPISKQTYDFEIVLDSMSNADICMNTIRKIFGKTEIKVEDGPYSSVIYTGKILDDFLKVCGLISVIYNEDGTDKMMEFNGDSDDDNDLAYYIPSEYHETIEDYYDEIKEYAQMCID